jgi:hypothetical protein
MQFNFGKPEPKTQSFTVNISVSNDKNRQEIDFLIQKFFEDVPEEMLLRLSKKLRKDPKTLVKLLNNPLLNLYI